MRQNQIFGFTWADQDWIGLMSVKHFAHQDWIGFSFIGSGLDSNWKFTQSAHLLFLVPISKGDKCPFYPPHRRLWSFPLYARSSMTCISWLS